MATKETFWADNTTPDFERRRAGEQDKDSDDGLDSGAGDGLESVEFESTRDEPDEDLIEQHMALAEELASVGDMDMQLPLVADFGGGSASSSAGNSRAMAAAEGNLPAPASQAELLGRGEASSKSAVRAAVAAAAQAGVQADRRVGCRQSSTTCITMCQARFELGIILDPKVLAARLPNCELKDFSVCMRRLRAPRWSACVTSTGRVQFTTERDGELARNSAKQFARLVKKRCYAQAAFKKYRMVFTVLTSRVSFRVDLEALAADSAGLAAAIGEGAHGCIERVNLTADKFHVKLSGNVFVCFRNSGLVGVTTRRSLEHGVAIVETILPVLAQHAIWW